jgi:hypothetical protein
MRILFSNPGHVQQIKPGRGLAILVESSLEIFSNHHGVSAFNMMALDEMDKTAIFK